MSGTVISSLSPDAAELFAQIVRDAQAPEEPTKVGEKKALQTILDELEVGAQEHATPHNRARLVCLRIGQQLGRVDLTPKMLADNVAATLSQLLNLPAVDAGKEIRAFEKIYTQLTGNQVVEQAIIQATEGRSIAQWTKESIKDLVGWLLPKGEKKEDPQRVRNLFPQQVELGDVDTAEKAGRLLAALLLDPTLAATIIETAKKLEGPKRERFLENLGAFAVLTDRACTALDYAKLPTGWGNFSVPPRMPMTCDAYKNRQYSTKHEHKSHDRQDQSRATLAEALNQALEAEDPAQALSDELMKQFLEMIGIPEAASKDWRMDSAAVKKAIKGEAMIPLRALFEATKKLDHRGVPRRGHTKEELNQKTNAVVQEITKQIVEGDFANWRLNNPASQKQLASLDKQQRATFQEPVSIEMKTASGRTLVTNEAQDVDLLWFTKVGGPSHGFDMLSQCLLPVMTNGRNVALTVTDEGWPNNPAARSFLRLLPDENGQPTLYLEMLQRDFPHYDEPVEQEELKEATIRHALEKAKTLGVPLALLDHKKEASRQILNRMKTPFREQNQRYLLEPSGAVFEASDSLLGAHHCPQTDKRLTVPVEQLIIAPL